MKLTTLQSGKRDGTLAVVSRDLRLAVATPDIAPTLQTVIDDWDAFAPRLKAVYDRLNKGEVPEAKPFDQKRALSPLTRAYQWTDASTYLGHLERMGRWSNRPVTKAMMIGARTADRFYAPYEPIRGMDEAWGIDFEAELAVITGDVPMQATPAQAASSMRLMMLCNDISLRNMLLEELGRGFGVFLAKPSPAFSPVAVTLDELGDAWDGGKLHLPVISILQGKEFGRPNAGLDTLFDFPEIIAYAAKTRQIGAGSIFASGTVSNLDDSVGMCCIQERRALETVERGEAKTGYMRAGDTIRIEVFGKDGQSIFGAIEQTVVG